MLKFLIGFVTAIVVVAVAGFSYLRFGFAETRADLPISLLERKVAMPSLDASVERHAPKLMNPVGVSEASLLAGMKIYQANCANCHGDITHPHGELAEALDPRPPQFLEDAPDMPENQNFYILQHGIRLTGMPAWKQALTDEQMWQLTTFLSHIDKLPQVVSVQWRAAVEGWAKGADVH
jgi:thiosulfate dehydrogenase